MMSSTTFSQLFVLVDVFIIGIIVPIAIRHANAHFHPLEHEQEPEKPRPIASNRDLPATLRKQLQEEAHAQFEAVVEKASAQLSRDLADSEARLTKQLEKLGENLVDKEMARYREELETLRKHAETAESSAQIELSEHQTALKAKMVEEIESEKKHLLEQIDTKLADAVASFLTETLQHNVDLGAQTPYLISQLEEHKADFKRELHDEARSAK